MAPTHRRLASSRALLLLVVLLPGCGGTTSGSQPAPPTETAPEAPSDEVKLNAQAVEKYGFTTEPARKHTLSPRIVAPARVEWNVESMAHVVSLIRGRIVEVKAKKGDDVKAGDVLLVVESPELGEAQSDFLQKRTAATVAASAADVAKDVATRGRNLYETAQGITLTELLKREGESKIAQGAAKAAQANLDAAENKLRLLGLEPRAIEQLAASGKIDPLCPVKAPIAGRAVDTRVVRGAWVGPEKGELFVLADTTELWVIASVPEPQLVEVAQGAKGRVRVAGQVIEGAVSLVDPSIAASTRTAPVRIDVKVAGSSVRPGMFALVEIEARVGGKPPEPVLALPEEAVQLVDGFPAVFLPVKDKEHTFVKRGVTVGKATGGLVPILSGLAEGEPVVTRSSFVLKAELTKGSGED